MENTQLKVQQDVVANVVPRIDENQSHPLGWGEYTTEDVDFHMNDFAASRRAGSSPCLIKSIVGNEWFVVFWNDDYSPGAITHWLNIARESNLQVLNYKPEYRKFDPPNICLTVDMIRRKAVNFEKLMYCHKAGSYDDWHSNSNDFENEIQSAKRRLRWLWDDMERLQESNRIISVPPIGSFVIPGEDFGDIVANKRLRVIEWCDQRIDAENAQLGPDNRRIPETQPGNTPRFLERNGDLLELSRKHPSIKATVAAWNSTHYGEDQLNYEQAKKALASHKNYLKSKEKRQESSGK